MPWWAVRTNGLVGQELHWRTGNVPLVRFSPFCARAGVWAPYHSRWGCRSGWGRVKHIDLFQECLTFIAIAELQSAKGCMESADADGDMVALHLQDHLVALAGCHIFFCYITAYMQSLCSS
ncbi:unnamed protein product [Ostreobium quekettii]|uniref:Uncharacterized protein n=1 Tax=Ostreobium quekettii TaxID=121088 RepID=A0A8S1J826_9CHLO|nr:unnamed protein product [Ostreobium quekettii]CAD7702235.1 unnamed protein product [Ostreobium quekettii]